MRCTLILVALPFVAMAAEPEPLIRLGSDRFRQFDQVRAIAYSPNGKFLVTADSPEIGVHVWDAADGRRLHTMVVPDRIVVAVWVANDRTVLAAGRGNKQTRFLRLDPSAGKVLADHPVIDGPAEGEFSPDGRWLVLRDDDGLRLRVTDTATGRPVWSDTDDDERFYSFAFRPDGKALAVGKMKGTVRVYDLPTGKVLSECKLEGGAVWNMAFAPDGTELVAEVRSPGPNHVVRFEAATGKARWKFNTLRAKDLTFTSDGREVRYWGRGVNASDLDVWRWLDASTGKLLPPEMDTDRGRDSAVRPDGKVLAIGGFAGHISQWDLTTRKRLDAASADPGRPVTELSFNADGSKVRGWAAGWYEWDVKTGKQTRLSPAFDVGGSETAYGSLDSKWLVRGSRLHLARIEVGVGSWGPIGTEDDLYRFLGDGRLIRGESGRLAVYVPGVRAPRVQVEADGGAVAASADGTTAVAVVPTGDHFHGTRYDLATGKPVGEWDGRLSDPAMMERSHDWRAELSPDGRVLAVYFSYVAFAGMGFNDIVEPNTALFDARTGRYLSGWSDLHFRADLAFSPDGRSVAGFYREGLGVDVREVATGGRRTRRPCPPIHSAAFSPDGRRLALATGPTPVALWDLVGKPAGPWADQKPANLWDGLASDDAEVAFDVIRILRQHPTEAVVFLKERVKVPTAPAAEWIAARIKALDAPQFRDREQATADLAGAGELIVPELRAALKTASPEARRRLEGLLEKATVPSRETWRTIRACEALEGIGTPAARELLATWAKGPPAATLTREAAESVERLGRRR